MDERMTMTTIIGIDCAVKEGNVGVAIGKYDKGMCALTKLPEPVSENWVLEFVCDSINESTRTLLALDAPLGWPAALGSALFDHSAGNEIYAPSNLLFRRATDRFIKTCLDKQPLDVGADRIARTAKAALDLLGQVREQTGFSIPLVWNASFTEKVGAVEVYPAGTLLSYGLPDSGYKRATQAAVRKKILGELGRLMNVCNGSRTPENNANVLDAIVCVLSGADFLSGQVYFPEDETQAKKEGWIWVKRKKETP